MLIVSVNTAANEAKNHKSADEKAKVQQVFKNYMIKYNHYITSQELKTSPELYAEQIMLMTGGKPVMLTPDSMNNGVTGFLSGLKEKGVDKVAWEKVDIKLLADNIALASNVAVRYLANGDVYDRAGATYFLNKNPEGWKITAFALHTPENALSFSPKS
jgi:hypothetical protein